MRSTPDEARHDVGEQPDPEGVAPVAGDDGRGDREREEHRPQRGGEKPGPVGEGARAHDLILPDCDDAGQ